MGSFITKPKSIDLHPTIGCIVPTTSIIDIKDEDIIRPKSYKNKKLNNGIIHNKTEIFPFYPHCISNCNTL